MSIKTVFTRDQLNHRLEALEREKKINERCNKDHEWLLKSARKCINDEIVDINEMLENME